MKALRLYDRSPPRFVYEDAPEPTPGRGEVLIRVHAAAVTPTEMAWLPTSTARDGTPRPLPLVMGHELSGEVAGLGPDVGDLALGAAVFGMNDWYRDGAEAEYCVARAADVAPKPATLDHVAAAVVPISALTAWQGLCARAALRGGERVLIHGASGAVGLFAIQLARWRGAEVIATASRHFDLLRELGADVVIDYRRERFETIARDVDVVFDGVGGDTLARSWDVLKPGGRAVTIAASEEYTTIPRSRDAFFIVEPSREQLTEIARLVDGGALRVIVGAVLPLADGAAAHAGGPGLGKTALRVSASADT
jgi:NADPH:quinone reductase-like Zn-dependent oxidoreductase